MKTPDKYGGRILQVEIEGHAGFIIVPADRTGDKIIDWVWHAPSFGTPLGSCIDAVIEPVVQANMAFVGVDVGESYGNSDGRAIYTRFYQDMVSRFHLAEKVVLLPQSRGGLMLYNWAAEHPEWVQRIAGIYTVCDMRSWPGLETAAPAYGMTPEQLRIHLPQCNPIERLHPLAAAKIPILHIHGDADEPVPLEANSGELLRRYRELGGEGTLVVVPGKGHAEIDEYFRDERLHRFIIAGT